MGSDLPWCSLSVSMTSHRSAGTVRNIRAASSSLSILIFLKVGSTLLQGPHQCEYTSTTATDRKHHHRARSDKGKLGGPTLQSLRAQSGPQFLLIVKVVL